MNARRHEQPVLRVRHAHRRAIAGGRKCLLNPAGLDAKLIASLVGLAPFARDSGLMRSRRGVRSGGKPVRSAPEMATKVTTRHSPTIRRFRECFDVRGKAKKLAVISC